MEKLAELSIASVERLLRCAGTQWVSSDAVIALGQHLEQEAVKISERAQKLSKYAGRKKVTAKDIQMALEELK